MIYTVYGEVTVGKHPGLLKKCLPVAFKDAYIYRNIRGRLQGLEPDIRLISNDKNI